jgi:glyoxylase-like metal-dependent hydrolase (beta-lactamase superfamily II)
MKTIPFSFTLGELEIFVINDYSDTYSADELIVNPNLEDLEQLTQEFSFELNAIPVHYNNLLIKAGNHNVLVDAGIPRPNGHLWLGLEALEMDPGTIDTLVITHSDLDHIGGIVDHNGDISCPNAHYFILADSWQLWSTLDGRAELARLNKWTTENAHFAWDIYSQIKDRIRPVKPDEEFRPGFRLVAAPGHRYDHTILKVTSADVHLIHIADALSQPLFMADRAWFSTYDADPAQAVATKIELLEKCVTENALVFGSHFPFPGLGFVHQDQDRWRWQPLSAS